MPYTGGCTVYAIVSKHWRGTGAGLTAANPRDRGPDEAG